MISSPSLEHWKNATSPVDYYPLFTFNFHEIYISETKTIKMKFLTQKQSKKLFSAIMWA